MGAGGAALGAAAVKYIVSDAKLSADGVYRYWLHRAWDAQRRTAVFIGLNPSTADAMKDDQTIRKCVGYADRWGYGGLMMLNVFAYRSRDPRDLLGVEDPIGRGNWRAIARVAKSPAVGIVVAAWGTNELAQVLAPQLRELIPNLHVLKLTKAGCPSHPLYLPGSLVPEPWPLNDLGRSIGAVPVDDRRR